MNISQFIPIKDICSLVTFSFTQSIHYYFWIIITALWPWYWLLIFAILFLWIVFEIYTRNGEVHYNSANGFSPVFNSFVGSGTYLGLQALLYLLFSLIFGDTIYCLIWPYAVHLILFLSTGLILHKIGFWPELRGPKEWRGKRKRFYR
jgi:hypothetical protein